MFASIVFTLVTRQSWKSASTSGKYFMSKKRQPPTCGKSLILYYEESISKALYLEWNTFVPSSVQVMAAVANSFFFTFVQNLRSPSSPVQVLPLLPFEQTLEAHI